MAAKGANIGARSGNAKGPRGQGAKRSRGRLAGCPRSFQTAAVVLAVAVAGCAVTTRHGRVTVCMTEADGARPDAAAAGVLVGGAVSIVTGSPWPAVAGAGSRGVSAIGEGLGRTAGAPATVLENVTTNTVEVR